MGEKKQHIYIKGVVLLHKLNNPNPIYTAQNPNLHQCVQYTPPPLSLENTENNLKQIVQMRTKALKQ